MCVMWRVLTVRCCWFVVGMECYRSEFNLPVDDRGCSSISCCLGGLTVGCLAMALGVLGPGPIPRQALQQQGCRLTEAVRRTHDASWPSVSIVWELPHIDVPRHLDSRRVLGCQWYTARGA